MDHTLRKLDFDFFGHGKHKITLDKFFNLEKCLLLDVRSKEETIAFPLKIQIYPNVSVQNIPLNEIPDRIEEVSQDQFIGIFCSGTFRSSVAYTYLVSNGFSEICIIENGYVSLTEAMKPGKLFKSLQTQKFNKDK